MAILFSVFGGFLIVAILYMQKNYFARTYFSFSEIITGFPRNIGLLALLVRMLIPFSVAGLIVFLSRFFLLSDYPYEYYFFSGLIGSFLVVWPSIYDTRLISASLFEQRRELYVLYVLFIGWFSFLSYLGGLVANSLLTKNVFRNFSPTRQGVVDGLYSALFVGIIGAGITFLNKRLVAKNAR